MTTAARLIFATLLLLSILLAAACGHELIPF